MLNSEDIIRDIETSSNLTFEKSFEYAQTCSSILNSNELEGRRIIINVLNDWNKIHKSTIEVWTDLIESAGFYPYLQKNAKDLILKNFSAELRKEVHESEYLKSKYYHDAQYELLKLLSTGKNVIVSAPTSFGKSLLIEEVIASKRFNNIVVIQPTLALLDETRKKLLKYQSDYKIVVRTSQEPNKDKSNIFLFTAERVNEYRYFNNVDFLVIDEFYKLSGKRDDERSSSLNNAFHYLLNKYSPKFYLLGPNIDKISDGFTDKYNAVFYQSDYTLVDSRQINIYQEHVGKFGISGSKKIYKESILFDLLLKLEQEQTIIYCSSPQRVRFLSKKFTLYLIEKGIQESTEHYPLIEWIEQNLSKDWSVLRNIKYNIGIHDGALQKHISTTIIDYFNQGKLKYLFCTSTIIEGVNTSAKNIIYFDSDKGPRPVDYFDYSNIKGRAGRMMVHYVGNIYNFNPPPQNELIIIDIPFFQQDPIKDEVLIQLNREEIKDLESNQFKAIERIPQNEREIIKNNGVKVHGQKSIFDLLREEVKKNHYLIFWDRFPTYEQLTYILGLAWDNLLIEGETTRPMTKKRLVKMTFDYGYQKDIGYLILSNYTYLRGLESNSNISDADLLDLAIQDTFQIMKHWFEYKVPKWLSVLNEIQYYICIENSLRPGNYTHYANLIENDFLKENLAILAEYGVPSSAIRKIENQIPNSITQDQVLDYIWDKKIYELADLLEYEKNKIRENLR